MENKDMPAMPLIDEHSTHEVEVYVGLTKREHFAAMAMQAMLSSKHLSDFMVDGRSGSTLIDGYKGLSIEACKYADALLFELAE